MVGLSCELPIALANIQRRTTDSFVEPAWAQVSSSNGSQTHLFLLVLGACYAEQAFPIRFFKNNDTVVVGKNPATRLHDGSATLDGSQYAAIAAPAVACG